MVVHDSQRMARAAVGKPDPTLEVHLPQHIGSRLLETLRRSFCANRCNDTVMSLQNRMNSRQSRRPDALVFQTPGDLARAPSRMGIAHRKHARFHRRLTAPWRRMGTPRMIAQLLFAAGPAIKPLVAGIRMDPEPSAKLTPVRSLLHRKPHKLTPLIHDRRLLPRHGRPPLQPNPRNDDVSTMSPNTRRSCLQAEHQARW